MRLPGVIALTLLALSFASCSRPSSTERFILADDAVDGKYSFTLDMADSLVSYDIWLYTRIDSRRTSMSILENIPVSLTWTSPSGDYYGEKVFFPASGFEGKGMSFFSRQIKTLYRSDVVPRERGEWTLDVEAGEGINGFRGMGVILERKEDGTR